MTLEAIAPIDDMTLLDELKQVALDSGNQFSLSAWARAKSLSRVFKREEPEFIGAVALASYEEERGNTCVDMERIYANGYWATHPLKGVIPEPDNLRAWVKDAATSFAESHQRPPVRMSRSHLYLDNRFEQEKRVGEWMASRMAYRAPADESLLLQRLNDLFRHNSDEPVDWQKIATLVAATRDFSVISGGPGTGKTTTVVRLLALMVEQYENLGFTRRPKIKVAAPTGKAANRLSQSMAKAINEQNEMMKLPCGSDVIESLKVDAMTLHRALGINPTAEHPRYNRNHKLDVDIMVIDEASMCDITQISMVVDALPEHARLVLVGDKDQLASVEAGAVMGNLCSVIHETPTGMTAGFSGETRRIAEAAAGCDLGDFIFREHWATGNAVVTLQKSYRFDGEAGIGRMAKAVRAQIPAEVEASLRESEEVALVDASQFRTPRDMARRIASDYRRVARQILENSMDPAKAFRAMEEMMVLTTTRQGPFGSENMNKLLAAELGDRQAVFCGMPVMVTVNAHEKRLFNGDIGIVLPEPGTGTLKACFADQDGGYRFLSLQQLPTWHLAFAMTTHKSQGSEWDRVCLVMSGSAGIETTELLYTALTRSRMKFEVIAVPEVVSAAVSRSTVRWSGMARWLTG